jgi:hypothetical protein
MSNLDAKRLSDVVLDGPKKVSQFVEKQFPSIYQSEGRELIELVKAYYRFLEGESNQSIANIRQIYDYRDVDKTLDSMLFFFKNKFLNGLFFDEDSRFIVKHILDLYRRKGSKEGIELFFRLFFEDEIEVYYPASDMFKPSQSSWREGKYLQLTPVTNISIFFSSINKKIFGSISGAEAFIDNVFFINIRDSIIPILFISNATGSFREFDVIYSDNPFIEYGSIYGSLNGVNIATVDNDRFTSNNLVGDRIEIKSSSEGIGAVGRVSKVNENFSGEIEFSIEDGGFGYTISNLPENTFSENLVLISQQLLFIENVDREYKLNEKIRQFKLDTNTEVIGIVVGQSRDSVGVILDESAPAANTESFFFETGIDIETVDRDEVLTKPVLFATDFNNSSSFEIGDLTNKETVTIITDIIEDFLDVSIGSGNFNDTSLVPFSGANTVNITTPLNVAIDPKDFEIGTISKLKNINPGANYQGDALILVKETLFSRFGLKNQIISLAPSNVNFVIGDFVTQQRSILDFDGNLETVTVRGKVVDVFGNVITVKALTYNQFVLSEKQTIDDLPTIVALPIFKEGISIPVNTISIAKDFDSIQAGLNAEILGDVSLDIGKIQEIEVVDSGFGYNKNETVVLMNTTKRERILSQIAASQDENQIDILEAILQAIEINGDAVGIATVNNQGKTEGRWTTFESHIDRQKVLQDSFFYQDYSYEVTTSVPIDLFEDTYKNIVHPAGLKFFSKFAKTLLINNVNDVSISRDIDFGEAINTEEYLEINENGFAYLIAEE